MNQIGTWLELEGCGLAKQGQPSKREARESEWMPRRTLASVGGIEAEEGEKERGKVGEV